MRGRYRLVDSVDSVDSVDMMVDKKLCYLYVRVCVSHLVTETRLQTVQCDGQQIVWPGQQPGRWTKQPLTLKLEFMLSTHFVLVVCS